MNFQSNIKEYYFDVDLSEDMEQVVFDITDEPNQCEDHCGGGAIFTLDIEQAVELVFFLENQINIAKKNQRNN